MISISIFILRTLLIAGVILFFFLRYIESRVLFYPAVELEVFPDQAGLQFQNVSFEADDKVRLNGWFVPCSGSRFTVLFCHGNAGNISHRLEKIKFFHDLGCSVFIFDYRGYGLSLGKPSEKGLYKDVAAAYGYLRSQGITGDKLIGYGESLGGAVIVELACKETVKALVLESSFSSISDMIKSFCPLIPSWVFASRFDSQSKIGSIKVPKLIIHSINDEIVPFQLGEKLYEAASEPKIFLQTHGGHNTNFFESQDLLRKAVGDFIGKFI